VPPSGRCRRRGGGRGRGDEAAARHGTCGSPATLMRIEVEEHGSVLGCCGRRRRTAEREAGGREGGREAHGAEESPPASVTPRDMRRHGRAAAVELEPWRAELHLPPPDRGRSAAAFSQLDAEESAAVVLRREAPPRGHAPLLHQTPPLCSSSSQAAAPLAALLLLTSSHYSARLTSRLLLLPGGSSAGAYAGAL
jgi:hypothetical protein